MCVCNRLLVAKQTVEFPQVLASNDTCMCVCNRLLVLVAKQTVEFPQVYWLVMIHATVHNWHAPIKSKKKTRNQGITVMCYMQGQI